MLFLSDPGGSPLPDTCGLKQNLPHLGGRGKEIYPRLCRIIQSDAMSSHGGNILVGRVQSSETVAETADQGVECLVRDAGGLFITPYGCHQIGACDNLSLALVEQPEHSELLCRKRWNELLLIHPD